MRNDERVVLTVSTRTVGVADLPEVCFSLPRIVGAAGVLATLRPTVSEEEYEALMKSVGVIRGAAASLVPNTVDTRHCQLAVRRISMLDECGPPRLIPEIISHCDFRTVLPCAMWERSRRLVDSAATVRRRARRGGPVGKMDLGVFLDQR